MKSKHIFVAALDVGEVLPFSIREKVSLANQIKEQDRVKMELEKFIDRLQDCMNEPIWYMGMDIIGEKHYERFIFDKGGFLEAMLESPAALNAHFVHKDRADIFCTALKKTLKSMLPENFVTEMFLESINVQESETLTVKKWHTLKSIREK